MKVIGLISQKGGVGKSTLALCLATSFQAAGKNTIVIDLDPQASAAEWHDARADKLPHVESVHAARLKQTVEKSQEIGADILILDTAPHSEATAIEAARLSDLILVPCRPSIVDLRAMRQTVDLLKLTGKPAFAVMNAVQHSSLSTATEAEKTIERVLGLPVCPVRVFERVAYSRSLITGQTAQEIEPDGKAAREIRNLYKWVCSHVQA